MNKPCETKALPIFNSNSGRPTPIQNGPRRITNGPTSIFRFTSCSHTRRTARHFGIDLASNPTRREALARSRDTGYPVATARISLAQETGNQAGFLIFVPIYFEGTSTETIADRRKNLRGFALGVYRVGDIVEMALADRDIKGIQLRITDESADVDQRLLFESIDLDSQDGDARLQTAFRYDVGGRKWHFRFTATPQYIAARYNWHSWLALIGGAMIALLLGLILNLVIGKAGNIEAIGPAANKRARSCNRRTSANRRSAQDGQCAATKIVCHRRVGNRSKEPFLGEHESRNPNTYERDHRNDRAGARHGLNQSTT